MENKKFAPINLKFSNKKVPENIEKEIQGKDWIGFGLDNYYPQFLVRLLQESAFHSGIINGKVHYIVGSGFTVKETPENMDFVKNGVSQKDLEEVVQDITQDFEMFDGFYLKIVKDNLGRFAFMEVIPFEKGRTNADKTRFYFSENWRVQTQSKEQTGFCEYPAYSPYSEDLVSVLYVYTVSKSYKAPKQGKTHNVYPQPNYIGGIKDIMSDIEISGMHYYSLVNGLKTSTLITFTNGEPAEDERAAIEQDYKEGLTPTENSGGIMLNFVNGQEQIPDIKFLTGDDFDKRYTVTQDSVQKKIFVAHGVTTPALFGIATQGALGSKQEMEIGFEIFKKTYVRARQKTIEKTINYIGDQFGYDLEFKMNEPEMPFVMTGNENKVSDALNQMSPLLANKVLDNLTINEIRALADLKRVADGDKIIPRNEPMPQEFADQQEAKFLDMASKLGRTLCEGERVVFSCEAKELFHKHQFDISENEALFLALYMKDNNPKKIAEALGISYKEVMTMYNDLTRLGYLEKGKITIKGAQLVSATKTIYPLEVLYKYEVRESGVQQAGVPIIAGTRNFCRAMINLGRFYNRAEIEQLNAFAPEGNAFSYRGGWLNNTETQRNELGCRHRFVMSFVVKD
jgi:hypothetical protein